MRRAQMHLVAFVLGMALAALACGKIGVKPMVPKQSPTSSILLPPGATEPVSTATAARPMTPLADMHWSTITPGPSPTLTSLPSEFVITPAYPNTSVRLRLGRGNIQAMDLSSDGQHLAVATSIGLYWYTADTFEQVWFYPTDYPVWCVAVSPDNQRLAFCSQESVMVFGPNGALLNQWGMAKGDIAHYVHWSPDGAQISIGTWVHYRQGSADTDVAIVNTRTGEQIHHFHGWQDAIWSPDGSTMALLRFSEAMLIDAKTGEERAEIPSGQVIVWSPDGKVMFGLDGVLRDAKTGNALRSVEGSATNPNGTLAWSPSGDTIATVGGDSLIYLIWNAETGPLSHGIDLGHNPSHTLEFSPDGLTLYSGSHGSIVAWDVQTGEMIRVLQGHIGWDNGVMSVAWSPDGQTVALGSEGMQVILWNVENRTREAVIDTEWAQPYQLSWSIDGTKLLVAGRTMSEGFRGFVWNMQEESLFSPPVKHDGSLLDNIVWSPDGSYYADCVAHSEPECTLRMHDTLTDNIIWERQSDGIQAPGWSLDGQLIAVGRGKDIELLSAETGQTLHRLSGHEDNVIHISWFSNSRRFISSSKDGVLLLWDAQSGQLIQKLDKTGFHPTISPDDTLVAIGREDNSIDLLSMTTGLTQQTLVEHTGRIDDMAWSPNGSMLVSASEDETVIFWKVER